MSEEITYGTIQEVKHKPVKRRVMQFTGRNGKAVAEFCNDSALEGFVAKARGTYVQITDLSGDKLYNIVKGDVVVQEVDGGYTVLKNEVFRQYFTVGKDHAFI